MEDSYIFVIVVVLCSEITNPLTIKLIYIQLQDVKDVKANTIRSFWKDNFLFGWPFEIKDGKKILFAPSLKYHGWFDSSVLVRSGSIPKTMGQCL